MDDEASHTDSDEVANLGLINQQGAMSGSVGQLRGGESVQDCGYNSLRDAGYAGVVSVQDSLATALPDDQWMRGSMQGVLHDAGTESLAFEDPTSKYINVEAGPCFDVASMGIKQGFDVTSDFDQCLTGTVAGRSDLIGQTGYPFLTEDGTRMDKQISGSLYDESLSLNDKHFGSVTGLPGQDGVVTMSSAPNVFQTGVFQKNWETENHLTGTDGFINIDENPALLDNQLLDQSVVGASGLVNSFETGSLKQQVLAGEHYTSQCQAGTLITSGGLSYTRHLPTDAHVDPTGMRNHAFIEGMGTAGRLRDISGGVANFNSLSAARAAFQVTRYPSVEQKLHEMEERVEGMEERLTDTRKMVHKNKNKIAELTSEFEALAERIVKLVEEKFESHSAWREDLESELAEVRTDIVRLRDKAGERHFTNALVKLGGQASLLVFALASTPVVGTALLLVLSVCGFLSAYGEKEFMADDSEVV